MRKINNIFTAVFITATCVSGAQAADLWQDYPPVIDKPGQTTDWSGFYAGVFAGYGGGRATSTGVVSGNVTDVDVRGGLLGATVGANAQFDNFVLGLEGDLAWTDVNGSATCVGNPTFDCNGTLNWLGSGKLRGGMAFDSLLLFGTAGVAAGGITASVNPVPGGATGSFSSTVWGWTVGAGAEYAVSDAISVKAEYSYYDFASVNAPINTIATGGSTDIKSNAHVAKLGLNYRF
ncbi:outer membrane immunogenic protein [Devosia subaequoris]|uniref:Outer membrane immunogenic protein n=1 Tax=Devosia subaequoris TaxID=395930 RepID=A0A7W6IK91_9HYPH|nr:outer membrane immunogenic protein [Devosia subaequoris]MCP1208224.1 porin family protein [Devosia subaequoris]